VSVRWAAVTEEDHEAEIRTASVHDLARVAVELSRASHADKPVIAASVEQLVEVLTR
jgi:hypothetical protein